MAGVEGDRINGLRRGEEKDMAVGEVGG